MRLNYDLELNFCTQVGNIVALALLISLSLLAACIPSRTPEPPLASHVLTDNSGSEAPADAEVERVATFLAQLLKVEFEGAYKRIASATIDCNRPDSLKQLTADAWRVGDLGTCMAVATCPVAKSFGAEHRFYLTSCTVLAGDEWYLPDGLARWDWNVALQIVNALRTQKPESIRLTGEEQTFVTQVVFEKPLTPSDEQKLNNYLLQQLPSRPIFADRLLELRLGFLAGANRFKDAIHLLGSYFKTQTSTTFQSSFGTFGAYAAVFAMPNVGLKSARILAESFVPFVKSSKWVPTERNPYTYSELYDSRCKETLTQGASQHQFRTIMNGWRGGLVNDEESLAKLHAMQISVGGKADILTGIGGLLHVQGDIANARKTYWQAHQACPFYHQAAIGMRFIAEAKVERNLASPVVWTDTEVEMLKRFVSNHEKLNADSLAALQYSVGMWKNAIPILLQANEVMHVKYPFEMMSEVPRLAFMRDQRRDDIPFDNRLWDDVRGLYSAVGQVVVADYFELIKGSSSKYDVTLHELSHQVLAVLPSLRGAQCIKHLYESAKARNVAVSSYSMVNITEYFAEASTAFGAGNSDRALNAEKLRKVDPDMYKFVENLSRRNRFDFPCESNGKIVENETLAKVEVQPSDRFRVKKKSSFRRSSSKRVLQVGEVLRPQAFFTWTDSWYWVQLEGSNGDSGFVRNEEVEKL